MSSQNIPVNTGNQIFINTNLAKIFIWANVFEFGTYTNSSYDDVTLSQGTLLGRITASRQLTPLVSSAVDGSAQPIGILLGDTIVPAGEQATLYYCMGGWVVEDQIIFHGSDDLNTVIGTALLRDLITRNTSIVLRPSEDLTNYDNS